MAVSVATSNLFSPLKVGNITLQNRIVLAPLTRYRADDSHVPLPLVKTYYAQRASSPGTLLITEGVFISPEAAGYPNAPGIWNQEQISAWKEITTAVHEKGSFVYLQLWALGRSANEQNLKSEFGESAKVVGASDVASPDGVTPTPLSEEEIQTFIGSYAQAAKNAIEAGFDGVEIHGANGYLVDQFNQDVSNKRTDRWGGSVENRSRFAVEVAKAVSEAVGADKTGIRLSPFSDFNGMKMEDPIPQFSHIITELKKLKLAYLHLVHPRVSGITNMPFNGDSIDFAFDIWGSTSPIFVAGGYTPETAKHALDEEYKGKEIATVFGRWFISNPDLVYRVKNGLVLNDYDRASFYKKKSADGYTDYPFSPEFEAERVKELKL